MGGGGPAAAEAGAEAEADAEADGDGDGDAVGASESRYVPMTLVLSAAPPGDEEVQKGCAVTLLMYVSGAHCLPPLNVAPPTVTSVSTGTPSAPCTTAAQ